VNILVRNSIETVRVESIDCEVQIEPGRRVASIESARLLSDTVEPGHILKGFVTLKPHKGERETVEIALAIPADFPEGPSEVTFCDANLSVRRIVRNDAALLEPHDLAGLVRALRVQTEPKRTALFMHVLAPDRGLSIKGQSLPNLPGSVRSVFATRREVPATPLRSDLVQSAGTPWVVEGSQSLRFTVVKDAGLTLSLYR
jgi:hypothetical protein